ncbi:MAG: hypothetical protein QNJ94_11055 [Alphaproteobacteria bacterium]|nr:hypothetical protein [Alphaproteobacteria bacterium]
MRVPNKNLWKDFETWRRMSSYVIVVLMLLALAFYVVAEIVNG